MKLLLQALIKFICGLLLAGILIFWPAGTFRFPNGWLLMAILFIPILIMGVVLLLKAPELLKKRLDSKEKNKSQKGVVALSALGFVGGFAVAGLDFRFGWSRMPEWVVLIAAILFLAAYGLYAEVMRENAYLSRTVRVEENQQVINTGLYGIVRHPMYAATVLLFLMLPLVLGSWWSFLIFWHYPVLILFRIRDEERLLRRELPGYEEYCKRIKYRLIPYVW